MERSDHHRQSDKLSGQKEAKDVVVEKQYRTADTVVENNINPDITKREDLSSKDGASPRKVNETVEKEKLENVTLAVANETGVTNETKKEEKKKEEVEETEEVIGEDPLRPFDEWTIEKLEEQKQNKEKKIMEQQQNIAAPSDGTMKQGSDGSGESGQQQGKTGGGQAQPPPVVVTHRNYASKECGAKILNTNPEAQNAKAVLNEKDRDEYLLNPCQMEGKKFFIAELCETIQPTRFEMANFELFSSSPKDVVVYGSERYPTTEWTLLGEWVAEDQREIQGFEVLARAYAKFIKVELLSHYSSEHFCPLSLIRVFGISFVDEFEEAAAQEQGEVLDSTPNNQGQELVKNVNENVTGKTNGSDSESKKNNLLGSATDAMVNIAKGVINKAQDFLRPKKEIVNETTCPGKSFGANFNFWRKMCYTCKTKPSRIDLRCWRLCHYFAPKGMVVMPYEHLADYYAEMDNYRNATISTTKNYTKMQDEKVSEKKKSLKVENVSRLAPVVLATSCPGLSSRIRFEILLSDIQNAGESQAKRKTRETVVVLGANKTESGAPQTPPVVLSVPGRSYSPKESIFIKLNNRIKSLELNISLSSQYLSELSRKYKKQMEDIYRQYNRSLRLMNETGRKAEEGLAAQAQEVLTLREEVVKLTGAIQVLKQQQEFFYREFWKYHACLLVTEIVFALLAAWCFCGGSSRGSVRALVREELGRFPVVLSPGVAMNGHVIPVANGCVPHSSRSGETSEANSSVGNDVESVEEMGDVGINNLEETENQDYDSKLLKVLPDKRRKKRKKEMLKSQSLNPVDAAAKSFLKPVFGVRSLSECGIVSSGDVEAKQEKGVVKNGGFSGHKVVDSSPKWCKVIGGGGRRMQQQEREQKKADLGHWNKFKLLERSPVGK